MHHAPMFFWPQLTRCYLSRLLPGRFHTLQRQYIHRLLAKAEIQLGLTDLLCSLTCTNFRACPADWSPNVLWRTRSVNQSNTNIDNRAKPISSILNGLRWDKTKESFILVVSSPAAVVWPFRVKMWHCKPQRHHSLVFRVKTEKQLNSKIGDLWPLSSRPKKNGHTHCVCVCVCLSACTFMCVCGHLNYLNKYSGISLWRTCLPFHYNTHTVPVCVYMWETALCVCVYNSPLGKRAAFHSSRRLTSKP